VITRAGNDILEKLRKINGGKTTFTDNLKVIDAVGVESDALVEFTHHTTEDGKAVKHSYNRCTNEAFDHNAEPQVKVWKATQTFIIKSSDLDALWNEKEEDLKKYVKLIDDPNIPSVDLEWEAEAKIEVLEDLDNRFQGETFKKFMADSKIQCEIKGSYKACLSQHTGYPVPHFPTAGRSLGADAQMAPASLESVGYSEAPVPVDASERGMMSLYGTYYLPMTVQKIFKDAESETPKS
jgi:hypothetical protein